MKIIFKHIIRNIAEKKVRTTIIILAITIVSALIFVGMSIRDTAIDMYQNMFTKASGLADIVVSNRVSFFYDEDDVELSEVTIEDKLPVLNYYGKYELQSGKKIRVLFYGTDVETAERMKLISASKKIDGLNKYEVIVSDAFAQSENLALGDKLKITVDDKEYEFKIAKLAYSTGIYTDETESVVMSISSETATDMIGLPDENIITAMYIDSGDMDVEEAIGKISYKKSSENYSAEKLLDEKIITEKVSSISQILFIALLLIIVLTGAVIISLYKHILNDRMPVMATFRSTGASIGKTNTIILLEIILYGMIGGVLGIIGGTVSFPSIYGVVVKDVLAERPSISFDAEKSLLTFLLSVLFAIVTATIVLMGLKRKSVKDALFNTVAVKYKLSRVKTIIGAIFLVITVVGHFAFGKSALAVLLPVTLLVGCVMMIPFLINFVVTNILKIVPKKCVFVTVASKNIKNSKVIIQNIIIMVIAITLANSVFSICESVDGYLNEATNMQAEIVVKLSGTTVGDEVEDILNLDFVEDAYTVYATSGEMEVDGKMVRCTVYGRQDKDNFEKIFGESIVYNNPENKDVKDGHIIVDESLLEGSNIEVGDKLYFAVGDNKKEYILQGTMDSYKFASDKRTVIVSLDDYKEDFTDVPVAMYFNASIEENDARDKVEDLILDSDSTVMTFTEYLNNQKQQTSSIMNIIQFVVLLGVGICINGIINNLVISYLARKKEFAGLYATAMNRGNIKRMIIYEILVQFLLAFTLWMIFSIPLVYFMNGILGVLGVMLEVHFPWIFALELSAALAIINILSGLGITRIIDKLNIMRELRYE